MWGKCVLCLAAVFVVMMAVGCAQPAPLADTPENRLEQARALTAIEMESGALDGMLDEGAALARKATADMLMIELEREPSEEDLAQLEAFTGPLTALATLPFAFVGELAWNLAWFAYIPIAAFLRRRGAKGKEQV